METDEAMVFIYRRLIQFLAYAVAACVGTYFANVAHGVVFTDATLQAGIVYTLPDPMPSLGDNAISVTGGAAAGDFDNDGWPDLFITRYWDSPILYRNNRDGTFLDVTTTAFSGGLPGPRSSGASWGDIDNDGDLDLYVPHVFSSTGNRLYINDGAGHFVEETNARGTQYGGADVPSMSASFGDYDNDGYLDMYVTEWRGLSGYTSNPPQARLLHNRGAIQPGYFEDVTEASGAAMGPLTGQAVYQSNSFTPRFVDFDRDGHPDIFVNSDFGSSRLFWNNGNGTLTDGTAAIDANLGLSDMGLAIGDVDGNGLVDFFTTDVCHPSDCTTTSGNRLFRNFGNRQFLESSNFSGVRQAGWGWGTQLFDYDNDRDLDIVATNGYYSGPTVPTGFEDDAVRLFRNNGQGGVLTTFTDVAASAGMTDTSQGRGLLTFDYDRDGDLDVFIVNNFQTPVLYRNDGGNAGDWLRIKAVGRLSNTDGVGAFITITPDLSQPDKRLVHEISRSSSFLSQSEPIAHFGLGAGAERVDLIRIEWPASGLVQELRDVAPNQLLAIVERHPADFNGDGQIDVADYVTWRKSNISAVPHGTGADANGDGVVDGTDYAQWRGSFGAVLGIGVGNAETPWPGQAVPEPLTLTLLVGGLLFVSHRAIRR